MRTHEHVFLSPFPSKNNYPRLPSRTSALRRRDNPRYNTSLVNLSDDSHSISLMVLSVMVMVAVAVLLLLCFQWKRGNSWRKALLYGVRASSSIYCPALTTIIKVHVFVNHSTSSYLHSIVCIIPIYLLYVYIGFMHVYLSHNSSSFTKNVFLTCFLLSFFSYFFSFFPVLFLFATLFNEIKPIICMTRSRCKFEKWISYSHESRVFSFFLSLCIECVIIMKVQVWIKS